MKKVLFALIALISFSAASFAQTTPTKKKEPAKTHVAKKAHHKASKAAKKHS
jgi:hypothetical protein